MFRAVGSISPHHISLFPAWFPIQLSTSSFPALNCIDIEMNAYFVTYLTRFAISRQYASIFIMYRELRIKMELQNYAVFNCCSSFWLISSEYKMPLGDRRRRRAIENRA
jgi:hypothetical protein